MSCVIAKVSLGLTLLFEQKNVFVNSRNVRMCCLSLLSCIIVNWIFLDFGLLVGHLMRSPWTMGNWDGHCSVFYLLTKLLSIYSNQAAAKDYAYMGRQRLPPLSLLWISQKSPKKSLYDLHFLHHMSVAHHFHPRPPPLFFCLPPLTKKALL